MASVAITGQAVSSGMTSMVITWQAVSSSTAHDKSGKKFRDNNMGNQNNYTEIQLEHKTSQSECEQNPFRADVTIMSQR